ncbi:hypothetical protein, partial [Enterobacter intestinihominis]
MFIRKVKNKFLVVGAGGGGFLGPMFFFGVLAPPPPGNSNLKANTTRTPGMMKKLLALALVAPLLVSCSSKKGDSYNEA